MKRIILLAALPSVAVVLGLITWSQFGSGWTSSAEQTAGAETAEPQETFAHNAPATVVTPAADTSHDGGPRLDDVLSPGGLDTSSASNPLRGRGDSEAIDLHEPKVTSPRVAVHPAAYQVAVNDDVEYAEDSRERRYAQAVRPQEPAPPAEVMAEPAPVAANPFNEDDFSAPTASQPVRQPAPLAAESPFETPASRDSAPAESPFSRDGLEDQPRAAALPVDEDLLPPTGTPARPLTDSAEPQQLPQYRTQESAAPPQELPQRDYADSQSLPPQEPNSSFAPRSRYGNAPENRYEAPQDSFDQAPANARLGRNIAEPDPSEMQPRGNPSGYGQTSVPPKSTGQGVPGPAAQEGPQQPAVVIEKLAPAEVTVGKSAMFGIVVRNVGPVDAQSVTVRDELPRGARFVSSNPPAERDAEGQLVWSLGAMPSQSEKRIELELIPLEEGELGSVATVAFTAAASVRTIATQPRLEMTINAPVEVMVDGQAALNITVTNRGTGVAQGVYLSGNLPLSVQHPAGTELEYEIGQLAPGETRDLQLVLGAKQAGVVEGNITAQGEAGTPATADWTFEIVAPALQVAIDGPSKRYLEKEAVYTLSVTNPGTAPARNVELVGYLPEGIDFVEADNYGEHDPATGAVYWLLEELPPGEVGRVTLKTLPTELGQHEVRIEGTADRGLTAADRHAVEVEGVAAILFQVVDLEDPVEVGGETTYEIRVINQGSKAATGLQLAATLPPQVQPIEARGPVRHNVQGQQIIFDRLAQLAPKADTTYRIRVQATAPGDCRLSVQLVTDQIQTPITKEESTHVYNPE